MSEVIGYEQAIEMLRGIDIALRARIVRQAIRGVTAQVASEMAKAAPVRRERSRSGEAYRQRLRQRLGDVLRTYRDGAAWWAAAGEQKYRQGQRHGHLVEFGHRMAVGGTVAQTRSYIGRKRKATRGQLITRTYTRRAATAARTGKGIVVGRVEGRPFMVAIIAKYATTAPEMVRQTLAQEIAAHVAGAPING